MLTVEQVFTNISLNVSPPTFATGAPCDPYVKDDWQRSFIMSVQTHIAMGRALSTEQARICLTVIRRCRPFLLETHSEREIDDLLANPQYRQRPYPSLNIPREVRWIGQNKLAFRSKRNDALTLEIKALSPSEPPHAERVVFLREEKIWIVPVNRDNIERVVDLIAKHRFQIDGDVEAFLMMAFDSRDQTSACVFDPEANKILINCVDNDLLSMWAETILYAEPV